MLHASWWRAARMVFASATALLFCSWSLADEPAPAATAPGGKHLDFGRDIRLILSDNCFKCHGFDEKQRAAGLRLDQFEGATAALESGAKAIEPGKPEASELIARILSDDPSVQMPPPESGKKLTAEQKELLRRWISEGAEYQPHWSFVPPQRTAPPSVRDAAKARGPIDQFLLAKLEERGMTFVEPADRVTLLRRVTLDLTGLPPTMAEVDAFLADTSPEAYEKVVDRLLLSPRYGEHMARYWLDAARYGDTHGLHFDNERSLWPYRDWVIASYNKNQPFDQFTIEQLAGDLLENATPEQKVATGFNRCNVSTSEGGSINDEVLVRYGVDRVETTSTVFMGLTMGCAVCHDHKFDPLTQKDFYSLFAFFSGVAENAMDGNALSPPPIMKLASDDQQKKLAELDEQLKTTENERKTTLASLEYVDPGETADGNTSEPKDFVWIDDEAPAGAQLQGNTPWQFITEKEGPVHSGAKATTRKADGLSQHFFTGATATLSIGEGDKLFAYVYLDPTNPPKEVMLQFNDGNWEHRCYWGDNSIDWGAAGTASRIEMGPLPKTGEWVRLEVEAAKVGLAPGAALNGWAFTQNGGTVYWDTAGIVTRTPQLGRSFESLAAWQSYEKSQAKSSIPKPIKDLIAKEADKQTDDDKAKIREYFLENIHKSSKEKLQAFVKRTEELKAEKTKVEGAIPTSLVMAEMEKPRETFVLIRGAYDKKGDKVDAGTPGALPPMAESLPKNRLGLAKWLVDPNHPLTARVAVNRYWQNLFGAGIVKTSEDFGAQGQSPTHPELLDWLAREYIESGWNTKHMMKLMVMSTAYQQSSKITADLLAKDPANEWLSRGPRFRLDAEAIRDAALFASGLLVEERGGRGVRPYQPGGIWEAVAFQGSNTQNYKRDEGTALFRRSIYTFWKRTAPPASLTTFDAPSREACVVRRARTNTPLQALVLMNDEQYVEAARKLAERSMKEGGTAAADQLKFAFRIATGRVPTEAEQAVLLRMYEAHLADYTADKPAAEKLIATGASPRDASLDVTSLAAMTMVSNLVLNLDEVVTKE
ncbi:protein of unknown function DUF1549 [Pirellula staleyi DSM 6068]|uniref:Cytochrome c domain-containing protein n=1 Tax=Pirellula staleyi (strain ATCC 27377 / DSM 6068 / ICPB 4128) TaxID=530564 RepID=D2R6Z6_PIRSD|nr:PSD1 and planctomycete cytochrome C domain-containing protein [Pirellula staleyi]ADB19199.1 protein of unknown function DUF1549 [Pirellula staleyi DSM 6068]